MDGGILRAEGVSQCVVARPVAGRDKWATRFRTTRWPLVRLAAEGGEGAREAFAGLYYEYWKPLLSFVARWCGHEQAHELTQKFFVERLIVKGDLKRVTRKPGKLFRSWLCTAMLRFVWTEWRRQRSHPKVDPTVSVDSDDVGHVWKSQELDPERQLWRKRAMDMLAEVLERLRHEYCENAAAAGIADPGRRFEAVKRFLPGPETEEADYAETARALGMSREAVKQLVCQLRKRFGKLLHEKIREDRNSDDDDVAMVKRSLCQALELPPEPGQ